MHLSALVVLLPLVSAAPWATKRSAPAPLTLAKTQTADNANKYIVKFREGLAGNVVHNAMNVFPHDADHVFENIFPGFAASLDPKALAVLREHPDVEYIEQDSMVYATGTNVTQKNSTWGLSRISHKQITKPYEYVYDSAGATKGVCVYVLDTGIDDTHPDFEGRAIQAKSTIEGEETDGQGHGTHVAGTIGSKTYGVAKGVTLIGVKVLGNNSGGSNSQILAGIDWVLEDSKTRNCPKGALANMSLGSSTPSQAINDAAAQFAAHGMFVSVAAGNDNQDAENASPASEPSVCTVGATNDQDKNWPYSNYGKAVDILAPGQDIKSTYLNHNFEVDSGTSMAAPHVAGLVAYLAAKEGVKPSNTWCAKLQKLAIKDAITGFSDDTVNQLLNNGIDN